jgi:hypothetical protein
MLRGRCSRTKRTTAASVGFDTRRVEHSRYRCALSAGSTVSPTARIAGTTVAAQNRLPLSSPGILAEVMSAGTYEVAFFLTRHGVLYCVNQ